MNSNDDIPVPDVLVTKTNRVYDLVILGATGFTGQFVLEEVIREKDTPGSSELRICAAGRNENKIKAGIKAAGETCGMPVGDIAVEVVDVTNEDALVTLASKTNVLMSCVGPYRMYGLPVVRACVSAGTDFLDISGEPQYLEEVQATLHESALKQGVHVVGSCGFDSVPADMGTIFLQNNFSGELSYVEMTASHHSSDGSNAAIHATTLECAVLGYANKDKLRENRSKILDKLMVFPKDKPPSRPLVWWNEVSREWCVANIGSDRSVVVRSQQLLYKRDNKTTVNFSAYFGMHSLAAALKSILFGVVFLMMSGSGWTRKMLIKHPKIFSFGMFSWAGPSRATLMKQSFVMTLVGKGYASSDSTERPPKPDTTAVCKITGPDPGYYGTARIFVQCALTMLNEKNKLPQGGGVFTPGAAFGKTTLIDRLNERGITFTMCAETQ